MTHLFRRPRTGTLMLGAVLCGSMLWWLLTGCAPGGGMSQSGQRVVDVLCAGDAAAQPLIVPVIMLASPAAGPAQPAVAAGVAVDQLLVHPGVVRACADHGSKPAAVVAAPPAGAVVAAPVVVN